MWYAISVEGRAPPRTQVLEECFRRYPDAPREVVLKSDLLGLGVWFSDAALEATRGSLVKSYRLFSYDLIPMSAMKRNESRRVPEHFTILGGMYGLRPVNVQTTLSPESPYAIDVVDGALVLTAEGVTLADVRFPRSPRYYEKRLPDGTHFDEIVALGFFITVFRSCQYWGPKEECRFCDINENARQMKQSKDFTLDAPVKSVADVALVADEIAKEQVAQDGTPLGISFLITGGTIIETLHGKTEDEFYGAYVEAVKHGEARRHVSLQTNAKPQDVLRRYKALGLDSHHANMEVWDRRLFEWMCPGKAAHVGWDAWVRRLLDSVELFEPGEVKPLFVGGAEMCAPHGFKTVKEAVASTTEGMDFLMSRGVVCRFNQWRREPKSRLVAEHPQPPVPLDFYVQLMSNRYEIWKKYGLPFPNQGRLLEPTRHLGVSHGTHEDFILLRENTYPADIVEIVERRSTPFRF